MYFTIVHDHTAHSSQHDHRLFLCNDGAFRSGIWSGCSGSTYCYKRLSAAMARFAKVNKKEFPNACIVAEDGGYTWNIHRVK
jgi:hypothetical protein